MVVAVVVVAVADMVVAVVVVAVVVPLSHALHLSLPGLLARLLEMRMTLKEMRVRLKAGWCRGLGLKFRV